MQAYARLSLEILAKVNKKKKQGAHFGSTFLAQKAKEWNNILMYKNIEVPLECLVHMTCLIDGIGILFFVSAESCKVLVERTRLLVKENACVRSYKLYKI